MRVNGGHQGRPILIADDHAGNRALLRRMLALGNHAAIEAADGDQAWDLLRQHRPAVALLDVTMPGRSGLELTRALRADPILVGTQVILVSGHAHESDVRAGLAA